MADRLAERRRTGTAAAGVLCALAAAVCYAMSNIVGRALAHAGMPATTALGCRFAVAAGLLALLLWLRGAPPCPERGALGRLLALGAVGYLGQSTLFYLALERGSAAACVLLYFCYPAIVTLIAVSRGHRQPPVLLAALGSSVAGGAVVAAAGRDVSISLPGIALALAAAAAYAAYLTAGRELTRRTDPMTSACWVAVGAGAASLTAGTLTTSLVDPLPHAGQLLLYGAATAGAFGLTFLALTRLPAPHVATVATTEALATVLLAALLLGETVSTAQVAGGLLIAVAAAITAWSKPGRPHPCGRS